MIAAMIGLVLANGAVSAVPSKERQFYVCQLLRVANKTAPAETFAFTYLSQGAGEVPRADWEVDDVSHVLPDLTNAQMILVDGYPAISGQTEGGFFNLMLTGQFSDNPKKPSAVLFTGPDRKHSNYTKLGRCENVPAEALKQSLGVQ